MTVHLLPAGSDLFTGGADAVVVPVNCVGVPGKGLALAAAKRWPEWASAYRLDCCGRDRLRPGDLVCSTSLDGARRPPIWVLSAAVKDHWRDPSRLAWVERCLVRLAAWCRGATSGGTGALRVVAVPALGCGLGGLRFDDVRPLAEQILARVPIDFALYAPHEAGEASR